MKEKLLVEIFKNLDEQKKNLVTELIREIPNDLVLGSMIRKVLYQVKDTK